MAGPKLVEEEEEGGGAFLTSVSLDEPALDYTTETQCATGPEPSEDGTDKDEVLVFLEAQAKRRRELQGYVASVRDQGGASGAVVHVVSGAPPQPMAALREVLLAFGPPFDALPLVPYAEWMRRVRLEAQLSLWPVMAWAEKLEEFPTFNRRGARLGGGALTRTGGGVEGGGGGFGRGCRQRVLLVLLRVA